MVGCLNCVCSDGVGWVASVCPEEVGGLTVFVCWMGGVGCLCLFRWVGYVECFCLEWSCGWTLHAQMARWVDCVSSVLWGG